MRRRLCVQVILFAVEDEKIISRNTPRQNTAWGSLAQDDAEIFLCGLLVGSEGLEPPTSCL